MLDIASEVVSIADACLGGLQGRSALLIGPDERRNPYMHLLRQSRMKNIYQETTLDRVSMVLPHVQLVISLGDGGSTSMITAGRIAQSCEGRHVPLLIFDMAVMPSVEELAGLLPTVCLYTPEDLRRILCKVASKAS